MNEDTKLGSSLIKAMTATEWKFSERDFRMPFRITKQPAAIEAKFEVVGIPVIPRDDAPSGTITVWKDGELVAAMINVGDPATDPYDL